MRFLLLTALFGLAACRQAQTQPVATEINVPVKNATISGTLLQPGSKTVVLMIAGSGPTDRNGNSIALPGKNNAFLQLADTLAAHGIASLRYDKRGVGKSTLKPGITEDSILFHDMVDDAMVLFHLLEEKGFRKIYILGHSEGSLVGMAAAQKVKAAGFISIAGTGRKAADILKEQLAVQLTGALKDDTFAKLDSLQNGQLVKQVNPLLFSLFRPSVQPYLISWFQLDPAAIIKSLSCPVIILQGTNDIQVTETDANALKAANEKARLVFIKDMNHVLKEVKEKDRAINMKSYSDPALPVMQQLSDEIINFISSN